LPRALPGLCCCCRCYCCCHCCCCHALCQHPLLPTLLLPAAAQLLLCCPGLLPGQSARAHPALALRQPSLYGQLAPLGTAPWRCLPGHTRRGSSSSSTAATATATTCSTGRASGRGRQHCQGQLVHVLEVILLLAAVSQGLRAKEKGRGAQGAVRHVKSG
jgi:hypothetical protein